MCVCDKPGAINLHDGFTVGPRYDYCYYMIIAIITRRQSVRGFLLPFFSLRDTLPPPLPPARGIRFSALLGGRKYFYGKETFNAELLELASKKMSQVL